MHSYLQLVLKKVCVLKRHNYFKQVMLYYLDRTSYKMRKAKYCIMSLNTLNLREGERERGREGERERGREGEKERGREGERERMRGKYLFCHE